MASTLTGSEFAADVWPTRRSVDAIKKRPSLGKRVMRSLTRLVIIFCIGFAAALGWQSYGDAAREMIASSFPQLDWLAPQAAPHAQIASEGAALAAPSTPSPELQQLREMSSAFATMRQSLDQLAANQQQMAGDIAKLRSDQQEVLQRISAPPPRPAAAPARKPAPPPSSEAR
jgi:PPE-repeat protein